MSMIPYEIKIEIYEVTFHKLSMKQILNHQATWNKLLLFRIFCEEIGFCRGRKHGERGQVIS